MKGYLKHGCRAAAVLALVAALLRSSPAQAHDCVFVDVPPVTYGDPMCPASDPATHLCTTEPVNNLGTVTVCTTVA